MLRNRAYLYVLLIVLTVQVVANSKSLFVSEAHYYSINAFIDWSAIALLSLYQISITKPLCQVFFASMLLHVVGFAGYVMDYDMIYNNYQGAGYSLLIMELLIIAGGYGKHRRILLGHYLWGGYPRVGSGLIQRNQIT